MRSRLIAIALLILISYLSYLFFIKNNNPIETEKNISESNFLPLNMRAMRKEELSKNKNINFSKKENNKKKRILKKHTLNVEKLMQEQISNQERILINELLNGKKDIFNGDGSENVEGSHEVAVQVFDDDGNLIVVYVNSPLTMVESGSDK